MYQKHHNAVLSREHFRQADQFLDTLHDLDVYEDDKPLEDRLRQCASWDEVMSLCDREIV